MEYLEGEDLRKFIDRKTFMPLEGKLQVMAEVCEGLAHAHANRIVHRDVKPSNIFLLKGGRPKLLDFGIARVFASQLTRAGNALGTPEYMSPEQIRGKETDARSDIFSAALVFFELLAHEHAFGESDIPRRIIQENPKPLRSLNPLIPERLEQILARAMSKDPEQRFQTAAEFAKALRKLTFEIMSNCERMINEALEDRQEILEATAVINQASGVSWMKKGLRESGVDTAIVSKIDPEMAKTTNANLHYFSLCSLSKDFAQAAAVYAEIVNEHRRICSEIERADDLVTNGKTAEALSVLNALQDKASDYSGIDVLRRQIDRKSSGPIEETRRSEAKLSSDATTVGAIGVTVVMGAKSGRDDASPELQRVRQKIKALLDQDVDRCLAEIEILSPDLASDPVIDSYWVSAMSQRKPQVLPQAKKAEPVQPAVDPNARQSKTPDPTPTVSDRTVYAALPSIEDEPIVVPPAYANPSNRKWFAGGAGIAVVLILVVLYGMRGSKPAAESSQPAAAAPTSTASPAPVPTPASVQPAPVAVTPPPAAAVAATPAPVKAAPVTPAPAQPETKPAAVAAEKKTVAPAPAATTTTAKTAAAPKVQVDVSKDIFAAQAALDDGNYDEAIGLCDKILRAQPGNKDAASIKQRAQKAKAFEAGLK
jgi:serine/threonine protein kinase